MKSLNIQNKSGKYILTLARNAGIAFLGKVIGTVLICSSQLLIARFLGPELFGLYSLGFALAGLAAVLSRMGLHEGAVRYVSLYAGEGRFGRVNGTVIQSLLFSFFTGTVIAVILFFASGFLAGKLFHDYRMAGVIRCFSLSVPFVSSLTVGVSIAKGFQRIRYFVYVNDILYPLLNLSLVTVLYLLGFKLYGAVFAFVAASVTGLSAAVYFIRKSFPHLGKTSVEFQAKKLVLFSLPVFASGFLSFIILRTDIFMLGIFRSVGEVGIYRACSQIAFSLFIFLGSFNAVFSPVISDLYNRGQFRKLKFLFKTVTKWIFLLTLPFSILVGIYGKEILSLFGKGFVIGYHPLVILMFAQIIYCGTGNLEGVLIMSGNQKIMLYNNIFIAFLNILLNLFLIPRYGLAGAAAATGLSLIFMRILCLVQIRKLLKMHPFKLSFVKGLIAGGILIVVVVFIVRTATGTFLSLSIGAFAGLLAYFSALLFLKLDFEDKAALRMFTRMLGWRKSG